jgi:hypothetical protein
MFIKLDKDKIIKLNSLIEIILDRIVIFILYKTGLILQDIHNNNNIFKIK